MVSNASRLGEAAKQTQIVDDDLEADQLPDGLASEISELAERLRRAKHALEEAAG